MSDRAPKLVEQALCESEARLLAIGANVPGMVFQLVLESGGDVLFRHVSEGCTAVCGLVPVALPADSSAFFELVETEDRGSFWETMTDSMERFAIWNWEGRIRVDDAIKWVNLRARPRRLMTGEMAWDGILLNITQQKLAAQELSASQEQLRELSAHLETVREEEKAKIAREIHDELGGLLTALKIDLAMVASESGVEMAHCRERLSGMLAAVDSALQVKNRIITELRPTVLDHLGLPAAIEWQVDEFRRRTGLECRLFLKDEGVHLDEKRDIALFRVLQEALTNIARHARATMVEVAFGRDGGHIRLRVTDNGVGISQRTASPRVSHGIRGMIERVRHIGGSLEVDGEPGRGTTVRVSVPSP